MTRELVPRCHGGQRLGTAVRCVYPSRLLHCSGDHGADLLAVSAEGSRHWREACELMASVMVVCSSETSMEG